MSQCLPQECTVVMILVVLKSCQTKHSTSFGAVVYTFISQSFFWGQFADLKQLNGEKNTINTDDCGILQSKKTMRAGRYGSSSWRTTPKFRAIAPAIPNCCQINNLRDRSSSDFNTPPDSKENKAGLVSVCYNGGADKHSILTSFQNLTKSNCLVKPFTIIFAIGK